MKHRSLHELYKTYKTIWLKKLLLACNRQKHSQQPDKSRSKKEKKARKKRGKRLVHSRQIRIDKGLIDAIQQFVQHTSSKGQPIYTSAASFIRDALTEYSQGLSIHPSTETERQITTLRLDEELNAFWNTLPRGKRLDILAVILCLKLGSESSGELAKAG